MQLEANLKDFVNQLDYKTMIRGMLKPWIQAMQLQVSGDHLC
jgi:hypothetical protein